MSHNSVFDLMDRATSRRRLLREGGIAAWAFHCHIILHAQADHGMFRVVAALVMQA